MNFRTTQMVDSADAELVARALEMNLRAQWSDVARDGSTIVLRGLGPTHRVNRNDKAIFAVKAADAGKTAIESDVTYQASAIVGISAPQNELVQKRLDGVLELVRMDVDLALRRAAQEKEREPKPWLVNGGSVPAGAAPDAAARESVTVSAPEAPAGSGPGHDVFNAGEVAVNGAKLSAVETSLAGRAEESADLTDTVEDVWQEVFGKAHARRFERPTSPFVAAASAAAKGTSNGVPTPAAERAEMRKSAEQVLMHRGEVSAYEWGTRPRSVKDRSAGKIFATLLIFFLLLGLGQAGWQYRAQLGQRVTDWRATLSGSQPAVDENGAPMTREQRAAQELALREEAAAEAEKAAEAARLAEPDPAKWLENWASALRGQDSGTQAAFYADQVEKYFLRRNVSRADIMADRQASIAKRKGTWTLSLDNLVVAEQTDTTARILLVKHVVKDGDGGVVDERLPTQIRLKRINGEWRIVSEQTLG